MVDFYYTDDDGRLAESYERRAPSRLCASSEEIRVATLGELALARFFGESTHAYVRAKLARLEPTNDDFRFDVLTPAGLKIDVKVIMPKTLEKCHGNLLVRNLHHDVTYVVLDWDEPRRCFNFAGWSPGFSGGFSPARPPRSGFFQARSCLLDFASLAKLACV